MRRAAPLLTLALAVATAPAASQQRTPRRLLFAGGGLALGLGVTAIYAWGDFNPSLAWCSSVKCVGITTTLFGGTVGYLIGREIDLKHEYSYRVAPPLDLDSRSRSLRTRAMLVTLGGDLLAAAGDEGVELLRAGPGLEYVGHGARGLRDVSDVGVRAEPAPYGRTGPAHLLVGTGTGLYLYAVSADAQGALALGGEVTAVAVRGTSVAVAGGGRLRVGTVGADDSVAWRSDVGPLASRVVDLRWQSDTLLWVLSEGSLSAFRVPADSALVAVGALELPGPARRLAVGDTVAAVAAGADGVLLVRSVDPTRPRVVARWTGPRYVYDVALGGDGALVWVAAGPEGLYILRRTDRGLEPLGLSRDVGFVAALAAGDDAIYAVDRTGGVLRRISSPRLPPP